MRHAGIPIGCLPLLCTLGFPAALVAGEQESEKEPQEGLAAEHPGDRGIAAHPSVLYATGFEDGLEPPLRARRNGVEILQDGELAHGGKGLARITATRGEDTGGDLRIVWEDGVERCHVRVYVRFAADTAMPHHFVNLGGHTPTYEHRWGGGAGLRPPGGKDGAFSATLEPPKERDGSWWFYAYWHEMRSWQTPEGEPDGRPNAYYGNNFRPPEPTPPLERERWICIEWMIALNTIGERDGELAFWIDGRKCGHWRPGAPVGRWLRESFHTRGRWFEGHDDPRPFEGFSWREHPSLKINVATLQWYLSPRVYDEDSVEENRVCFDDLVIATEYVGPMR